MWQWKLCLEIHTGNTEASACSSKWVTGIQAIPLQRLGQQAELQTPARVSVWLLTCASTGSPSPAQWFLTAGLCCTLAGAARCRCRSGGCRAPICYSKVERWQCNETDRWGVSSADSLHSFAPAKRRAEAFDTELQWDLRTFSSYQAGVAVIETQLSGYIPVGVLLHVRHIWKLDGRAELFKLQLQTRGFLHERRGWEGERSLGGGITVFTQRCMCQQVMRRIRR